jgi:hypothetical protein
VQLSIANGMEINRLSRQVALSKAALKASTSDRVVISCKCKGYCNSRRCRCFKEQQKCSIHCHGGDDDHDCGLLSSLELRTEKALVSRARVIAEEAGPGSRSGSRKRAQANTASDQID